MYFCYFEVSQIFNKFILFTGTESRLFNRIIFKTDASLGINLTSFSFSLLLYVSYADAKLEKEDSRNTGIVIFHPSINLFFIHNYFNTLAFLCCILIYFFSDTDHFNLPPFFGQASKGRRERVT